MAYIERKRKERKIMICTNCKKKIEKNVKFCPYCGTRVNLQKIANKQYRENNVRIILKRMICVSVIIIAVVIFLILLLKKSNVENSQNAINNETYNEQENPDKNYHNTSNENEILEISEILESEPNQLLDIFNMEKNENWQLGENAESYKADGLQVEWLEGEEYTLTSAYMKDNEKVKIYGITLGMNDSETISILNNNGYIDLGKNDTNTTHAYAKNENGKRYVVNMQLENDTVTGWYWNNWREGEDLPDIDPYTYKEDLMEKEKREKRSISFDGDIIINEDIILVLKDDGTVWGKGRNETGSLGNGRREDSTSWVQVTGVENVVGIYATMNYGTKSGYGEHCYALCEDGTLYRWGGNIFTPEKVEIITDVVKVSRPYQDKYYMTLECKDGTKYVMIDAFSLYTDDKFIPFHSDAEDIRFSQNYYLSDGTLCYYDSLVEGGLSRAYETRNETLEVSAISFEERLENNFRRVFYVEGINVQDANDKYFIDDKGSVYRFNWESTFKRDPNMGDVESLGGSGYCQRIRIMEGFLDLFCNGELRTHGKNTYGELGDGTTNELYGGAYTVTESEFRSIKSNTDFVAGIDFDGNVWAWGKGYGSTPHIVVSRDDFSCIQ